MKRYTKEAATAEAQKVCGMLEGEASFKLYERDGRYGKGYIFIVASGCVSVKSTQPERFTARYQAQQRGISSECIDHDGATAALALYALKFDLHERQRHMQEAKEIINYEQP